MPRYFIDTPAGRKGPFSADAIARDVRLGRIALSTVLIEDGTGRPVNAAEAASLVERSTDVAPDSSPPSAPTGTARGGTRPVRPPVPRPRTLGGQLYPPPFQTYAAPVQQGSQYQPYGMQGAYPHAMYRQTSGLAIASLVLSLSGLVCGLGWIAGIICGILAMKETGPNGPKKGRGLAIAGLVIGAVFASIFGLYLTLMAAGGFASGF